MKKVVQKCQDCKEDKIIVLDENIATKNLEIVCGTCFEIRRKKVKDGVYKFQEREINAKENQCITKRIFLIKRCR